MGQHDDIQAGAAKEGDCRRREIDRRRSDGPAVLELGRPRAAWAVAHGTKQAYLSARAEQPVLVEAVKPALARRRRLVARARETVEDGNVTIEKRHGGRGVDCDVAGRRDTHGECVTARIHATRRHDQSALTRRPRRRGVAHRLSAGRTVGARVLARVRQALNALPREADVRAWLPGHVRIACIECERVIDAPGALAADDRSSERFAKQRHVGSCIAAHRRRVLHASLHVHPVHHARCERAPPDL